MFTPEETAACRSLVELALEEDLGPDRVDLTSKALIPPDLQGKAIFVARAPGIIAGLPAVRLVLDTPATPLLKFEPMVEDGSAVRPGDRLAVVTGLMEFILVAERTALNFLQRLSGVATLTRRYVDAVAGTKTVILDTRKTTPGWRLLEKYAVRCGGGQNHRMGLYDGIFIKDNHLAALGGGGQTDVRVTAALVKPRSVPAVIEVDKLDQLEMAFGCLADIVLLDNMEPAQLREAVRRRDKEAPEVLLEASGGVTLETIRSIAETGVDRISVGALTHSAPALDIALDYEQ